MRVLDIVLKDLKIILSDKKAMVILILMPIILISILGGALSGSFMDAGSNSKINVAIVKKYDVEYESSSFLNLLQNNSFMGNFKKEDLEELTKSMGEFNIDKIFTDDFLNNPDMKKILNYGILTEGEAYKKLEAEEVSVVVILPKNFIYNSYVNFFTPFRNKTEIEVIANQDRYISSQIVEGIMRGFSNSLSSLIIGKNVFLETSQEEGLGDKALSNMGVVIENITNKVKDINVEIDYKKINGRNPISSFQYYAVAMTVMFILFAASHGGKSLLEEKHNLTYQRMNMAGIPKWKIVSGKFTMVFLLGLIQISIIVVITSLVLNVNWGNLVLVITITLSTVFAVAGLGTMLAALTFKSNNYKAADLFQAIFINVMAAIGGSFIPIDGLPKALKMLSNLTINGVALKSYQRVMLGEGISQISSYLMTLIIMGVIFTVVGIYILRDKEGKTDAKYTKTTTN